MDFQISASNRAVPAVIGSVRPTAEGAVALGAEYEAKGYDVTIRAPDGRKMTVASLRALIARG